MLQCYQPYTLHFLCHTFTQMLSLSDGYEMIMFQFYVPAKFWERDFIKNTEIIQMGKIEKEN